MLPPQVCVTSFYITIACIVLAGLIGVVGIWIEDFFDSDLAPKLFGTAAFIGVPAFVIAVITYFFK